LTYPPGAAWRASGDVVEAVTVEIACDQVLPVHSVGPTSDHLLLECLTIRSGCPERTAHSAYETEGLRCGGFLGGDSAIAGIADSNVALIFVERTVAGWAHVAFSDGVRRAVGDCVVRRERKQGGKRWDRHCEALVKRFRVRVENGVKIGATAIEIGLFGDQ
jgi:hypothetical protein